MPLLTNVHRRLQIYGQLDFFLQVGSSAFLIRGGVDHDAERWHRRNLPDLEVTVQLSWPVFYLIEQGQLAVLVDLRQEMALLLRGRLIGAAPGGLPSGRP